MADGQTLTVEAARALVARRAPLRLDAITSLSPGVAAVMAEFECFSLGLAGLTSLSAAAREWARIGAVRLSCAGLTALPGAMAAALATQALLRSNRAVVLPGERV